MLVIIELGVDELTRQRHKNNEKIAYYILRAKKLTLLPSSSSSGAAESKGLYDPGHFARFSKFLNEALGQSLHFLTAREERFFFGSTHFIDSKIVFSGSGMARSPALNLSKYTWSGSLMAGPPIETLTLEQ